MDGWMDGWMDLLHMTTSATQIFGCREGDLFTLVNAYLICLPWKHATLVKSRSGESGEVW